MNPEITKIIDQYLSDRLSKEDKEIFEQRLNTNNELRQEVEHQRELMQAIKRNTDRIKTHRTIKSIKTKIRLKWTIGSILGFGTIALIVWWGFFSGIQGISDEARKHMEEQKELKELDAEYFQVPNEGALLMTKSGVLLSFDSDAFLLNGKPYEGEVYAQYQEAIASDDIVLAGLSTMSGDQLLETQGMFSLKNYSTNGVPLELKKNKSVYVQVPVNEAKSGMELYQGNRKSDGSIDWIEPRPLQKKPVIADMNDLNFYPKDFEPYLDEIKWMKDKKSRDSLYLSFDCYSISEASSKTQEMGKLLYESRCMTCHSINYDGTGPMLKNVRQKWAQGGAKPESIYTWVRNWEDAVYSDQYAIEVASIKPTKMNIFPDLNKEEINAIFDYCDSQNECFEYNRRTEESRNLNPLVPRRKLTGEELDYLYGDHRSIDVNMTLDEALMLCLWRENPNYSDFEQITIRYYGEIWEENSYTHANMEVRNSGEVYEDATDAAIEGVVHCNNYIQPSSVLGFWSPKMNGTNLATRDFERRMQAIHKTCNNDVLLKYTSQLEKPLSTIDQEIADMGYPEFQSFADEYVGKVDITNAHSKRIQSFYEEAVKQWKERGTQAKKKEEKRRQKWDKNTKKSREKEIERRTWREQQAYNEEYNFNLKNVKKQMGSSVGFDIKHGDAPVLNIDAQVEIATRNRQTTTIVNPITGETAEIKYNEFSVEISNSEKYGKLFAYLFPSEINSYQRITSTNGKIEYTLNDDMIYDVAVVGINDSGYHYYQKQSFKKGDLGTVKLTKINEEQFKASLKQINRRRASKSMNISNEMDWLIREKKDYTEKRKRKEDSEFRRKVAGKIFPCIREECQSAKLSNNFIYEKTTLFVPFLI